MLEIIEGKECVVCLAAPSRPVNGDLQNLYNIPHGLLGNLECPIRACSEIELSKQRSESPPHNWSVHCSRRGLGNVYIVFI